MTPSANVVAIALLLLGVSLIQVQGDAGDCWTTTYPNCSAYFNNQYGNCPEDGFQSATFSGGAVVSKCTEAGSGSLTCRILPRIQCSYTLTVIWCDGTSSSQALGGPVDPTQADGDPCGEPVS